ncbi:MAG: hypothetical protein IJN90_06775 [Bacilli bacterium]|nr:hypothetical protein [Bacilli bacterium]
MGKILKYIDCNGIIIDTEKGLFDEYHKLKKTIPTLTKKDYLERIDWDEWIKKAPIVDNAIDVLKSHEASDTIILTKVSSIDEGVVKIDYLRNLGVKNTIGLVPYVLRKSQISYAKGNILFDNSISNLDYWYEAGGIPIYYSDKEHEFYPTTTSLDDVLSEKILEHPKIKTLQKRP